MKLAWATDIHLDHASESARRKFCQSVREQADALVVTGDIAESHILGSALESLATLTERPVYFVLGNHDFYRGSVACTRRQVGSVVREGLVYLSQAGVVELMPTTALVGHDGWADGRLGYLDGSDGLPADRRVEALAGPIHTRQARTAPGTGSPGRRGGRILEKRPGPGGQAIPQGHRRHAHGFCGQLAGAYWGESGIPVEWRDGLARKDMIEEALRGLLGDRK